MIQTIKLSDFDNLLSINEFSEYDYIQTTCKANLKRAHPARSIARNIIKRVKK